MKIGIKKPSTHKVVSPLCKLGKHIEVENIDKAAQDIKKEQSQPKPSHKINGRGHLKKLINLLEILVTLNQRKITSH
jgi:hypothetical protein